MCSIVIEHGRILLSENQTNQTKRHNATTIQIYTYIYIIFKQLITNSAQNATER